MKYTQLNMCARCTGVHTKITFYMHFIVPFVDEPPCFFVWVYMLLAHLNNSLTFFVYLFIIIYFSTLFLILEHDDGQSVQRTDNKYHYHQHHRQADSLHSSSSVPQDDMMHAGKYRFSCIFFIVKKGKNLLQVKEYALVVCVRIRGIGFTCSLS